jgi:prepilin-type N-terminal cleavage/methylation domain-containing protein
MTPRTRHGPDRGFTLLELMLVIAIIAVIVPLLTSAIIDVARFEKVRKLTTQVQGESRMGVKRLELSIRLASLGAKLGQIRFEGAAGIATYPAVEIYDNVAGGGFLDVKAGTDVLVVVGAASGAPSGFTEKAFLDSTAPINVTEVGNLQPGDAVLVGPMKEAAWIPVRALSPPGKATFAAQLLFDSASNVIPLHTEQEAHLVRRAEAWMFYVNNRDELVRAQLRLPTVPQVPADVTGSEVVSPGLGNLQIGCEIEVNPSLQPCGGPLPAADPANSVLYSGAVAALGDSASGGGGPLLNIGNIATLRTVTATLSLHSVQALRGDLARAGDGDEFVRRVYRLGLAVRNTSLEVL